MFLIIRLDIHLNLCILVVLLCLLVLAWSKSWHLCLVCVPSWGTFILKWSLNVAFELKVLSLANFVESNFFHVLP